MEDWQSRAERAELLVQILRGTLREGVRLLTWNLQTEKWLDTARTVIDQTGKAEAKQTPRSDVMNYERTHKSAPGPVAQADRARDS